MKKENTDTLRRLISPFIMLMVTTLILIACTVAWFTKIQNTHSGGMEISNEGSSVFVKDVIRVKRIVNNDTVLRDSVYKESGFSNFYYLFDLQVNDFVLDASGNKIPFHITELLPGETIEISLYYSCSDNLQGRYLDIVFDQITSEKVYELENPDIYHSVLGVYKASVFNFETNQYDNLGWLQEYKVGVKDEGPSSFPLKRGLKWNKVSDVKEDNYREFKFRLTVDFTQYALLKTSTNELSEKSFTIGSLKVKVQDE